VNPNRLTKAQLIARVQELEAAPAMLRSELAGKKTEIDRLAGELFAKRAIEPPLFVAELKEQIEDLQHEVRRQESVITGLRGERVGLLSTIQHLQRPSWRIRFRQWLVRRIEP
jgi:uncharacterized small protein (DUF1192 family)